MVGSGDTLDQFCECDKTSPHQNGYLQQQSDKVWRCTRPVMCKVRYTRIKCCFGHSMPTTIWVVGGLYIHLNQHIQYT
uniref:Uncharacterized protein n=1 Tax=Zea mays TaxID=4577 RepID=C0PEI8_MAIZE|nr:unknown [Zea mays]